MSPTKIADSIRESASGIHQDDDKISTFKTTYTNDHDKTMALRQLAIDKLSENQQKEQDDWAQQKLIEFGACPAGFGWRKYTVQPGYSQFNGYRCFGGASTHLVAHQLLAEGRPGLYIIWTGTYFWTSPYCIEMRNGAVFIDSRSSYGTRSCVMRLLFGFFIQVL
ncbi:hypothetical protein BKA61DRAFT_50501 [Leptodontidium sp. MPI-SDFR-AT-0119]|nr:hypothetical protein BKA61DRAFT_50501 [Leptodontidium sp. MPI-SDFR-AT-0119]